MDCGLPGSSAHGDSPVKKTRVGCHALLQGIFPTQGSNPDLLHCRWILNHLILNHSSPGKLQNTGVGSLSLLQKIFPTQELNQGLLHCRQILYQLNYQGSGQILFWQIILSRFSVPPSICYSTIECFSLQILTPFDHFSLLILFTGINDFSNPTYKITCPELFTLMGQAHCFLLPELSCKKSHQNLITYIIQLKELPEFSLILWTWWWETYSIIP